MMDNGKRMQVFCPISAPGGKEALQRIGSAFVNSDDSIVVYLDAYPANGKLIIKPMDKKGVE